VAAIKKDNMFQIKEIVVSWTWSNRNYCMNIGYVQWMS